MDSETENAVETATATEYYKGNALIQARRPRWAGAENNEYVQAYIL
jgi:hypothetical protein